MVETPTRFDQGIAPGILVKQLGGLRKVVAASTSGIAAALNEGWKRCRGRYVARLDGDDCAHPQRLMKQIGFLERHPSIAILGGGFCTFEDSDPRRLHGLKRYRMPCHPILARWRMIFSCSLAHPTVTFRRSAFQSGPYPEGREAEDHWWVFKKAIGYPKLSWSGLMNYPLVHHQSLLSIN